MAIATPLLARRRWLRALAALPLAGLGGCVVAPYGTYYRPSTGISGARGRKAWCQGQAGPETGLDADLGGLRLSVRSERMQRDGAGVRLHAALTLPPGRSLRLDGPLQVRTDGRLLPVAASASVRRSMVVPVGSWVDAPALRPGRLSRDAQAPQGRLVLQVAPAPAQPPRIVIEGLVLRLPSGEFVLPASELARPASRRLPDFYRSEGEQAASLGRAAACRRDTPQAACDNLVEFGNISHAGQDDRVGWQGRWYQARVAGGARLEGAMTLMPQVPGRWWLDPAGFRVRAAPTGPSHPLQVARVELLFDDQLEQRATIPASGVETRIQFEALLPDGLAAFELVLPSMDSEAGRLQLPPVLFERRSFDGGVEPFNC